MEKLHPEVTVWELDNDCTISTMSGTGSIRYNGYTLTVGDTQYTSGSPGVDTITEMPNAFSKSKAKKVILKTKKLTRAKVKGCLKNSKVKTIKVNVGVKKVNRNYVKKYRKIFTKKNAGKRVPVV